MPSIKMDVDVDTTIEVNVDLDSMLECLNEDDKKYLREELGASPFGAEISVLAESVYYQSYGKDITPELRELLRAVTGRVI